MPPKRQKPLSKRDREVYIKYGVGDVDLQNYTTLDFEAEAEAPPAQHEFTPDSIKLLREYGGRVPIELWSNVAPGAKRVIDKRAGVQRDEEAPLEEDEFESVTVLAEELSSDEEHEDGLSSDEAEQRQPHLVDWASQHSANLETWPPVHFFSSKLDDDIEMLDMRMNPYPGRWESRNRWTQLLRRFSAEYYIEHVLEDRRSMFVFSVERGRVFLALYMERSATNEDSYCLLNYFLLEAATGFAPS